MTIEDLRKHRLGGVALFDLVLTFVAAYLLDKNVNFKNKRLYYLSIMPIAVLSHLIIGQKTFVNSQIVSNKFNGIKLVFLIMCLAIVYELVPIPVK